MTLEAEKPERRSSRDDEGNPVMARDAEEAGQDRGNGQCLAEGASGVGGRPGSLL